MQGAARCAIESKLTAWSAANATLGPVMATAAITGWKRKQDQKKRVNKRDVCKRDVLPDIFFPLLSIVHHSIAFRSADICVRAASFLKD
jgi:hypothetical protein